MDADLVIINGKVITVDGDFSLKQAVAVKDGKIVAVGSTDECRALMNPTCMRPFSGPADRLYPST